jgi:hypothetical protein
MLFFRNITQSLTLGEENILRVFEKKILKIFGPKR